MRPSNGSNWNDFRGQSSQWGQNMQPITFNNNFQNSNLLRTSKQPQKKRKPLVSIIMVVLYAKKIRKSIKKRKHRQKILEEWFNTQCSYNLDLNIAVGLIKKPMVTSQIINADQSQILFPEFEGMIQLSGMMLQTINRARKTANPNKIFIGKQLNKFASGYKLYGGYFGSHGRSSKLLAELGEKYENQLKQIQTNMQTELAKKNSKKQTMTIKDCMEQPLYRLFKYVLLLKEYLKKLPKYHPDYDAVTQCHHSFHDINNFNNDLMKKLEDQQKKVKLDALFGEVLRQNRVLVAEMQASTIYFDAKLYIFNDIVIITKVHTILGTQKQQKYGNLQLDQFSYVAEQENMKYFKNILILINKQQSIHLFFPDEGSRLQLFKCVTKIIKQLRIKFYDRKKLGDIQKNPKAKKITFTMIQQNKNKEEKILWQQFRIQILGIQVRPLSSLTNDTVYVTRFMMPYYYQDEVNFLNAEGIDRRQSTQSSDGRTSISSKQDRKINLQRFNSLPFGEEQYSEPSDKNLRQNTYKCINQRVQIHFSTLQQIYKQAKYKTQDRLPDIDPITKDVNIYAKGKRKTKAFEMRKFFIEEFLNFAFRHPNIMSNPIFMMLKFRVNDQFLEYTQNRFQEMKYKKKQEQKDFGYDHCLTCKKGKINSVQEYEHYRNFYNSKSSHRSNKQSERYCFNFFNLLRMRMLSFNYICFNTLERILIFYHLLQGRLDYPFLKRAESQKTLKLIKVYLPSLDDNFVSVMIDIRSTVGEVLDELANMFKMRSVFDFDLMATYSGKNRLLDRDQFIIDVVKSLNIDFQEVSSDRKQVNNNNKTSFFDSLKKWGKQMFQQAQEKNKIFFIKTTYLHRSLQMKSFVGNPQKKLLQIQKIFWSIKKGLIKLTDKQFIQIASLFYCLKQLDVIQHFSYLKMSNKQVQRLIPDEHHHTFQYQEQFRRQIGLAIERQKNTLMGCNKNTSYIHARIVDMITQKVDYMTYYIDVQVKEIPEIYLDKKIMPATCLLGVNYKQLIITRNEVNTSPLVALPLDEIEYSLSVFSIFITHESCNFRFDSKMLHHFGEMLKKYQIICKKFPQHMAS